MFEQESSCHTICYDKRDEGDVGEDTSKNLPRKAQARNAFTPRRGFIAFSLIATCWHFSSLKFHSLSSWLEFEKPFCLYCFIPQLMFRKCGETQNTFLATPRLRRQEDDRKRKKTQYWILRLFLSIFCSFSFNFLLNSLTSTSHFNFLCHESDNNMLIITFRWKFGTR